MKLKVSELTKKVNKGLEKLGYAGDDLQTISEVLMYAQLRDNNQGITKIATGGVPQANDVQSFEVVKENKAGALVSGGNSMVATRNAVNMAVELADKHGLGIVGANHTFTSSGSIGYFARKVAEAGYIGLVCTSTVPLVAPHGSSEAMLGTNPIAYAFPTKSRTVVFDTTTAAMAYFGVVEAKLKGEQLPDGIAFDSEGHPTNDPAKALDGAIAPLAKHKGSGLSLLVQVLGGPFASAGYLGLKGDLGSGTFVLAIDPGLLADKEAYLNGAEELISKIKAAKPANVGDIVYLPGEHGDELTHDRVEADEIEVADAIYNELEIFIKS